MLAALLEAMGIEFRWPYDVQTADGRKLSGRAEHEPTPPRPLGLRVSPGPCVHRHCGVRVRARVGVGPMSAQMEIHSPRPITGSIAWRMSWRRCGACARAGATTNPCPRVDSSMKSTGTRGICSNRRAEPMTEFTLDTSGVVVMQMTDDGFLGIDWLGLSPSRKGTWAALREELDTPNNI